VDISDKHIDISQTHIHQTNTYPSDKHIDIRQTHEHQSNT